ncbi:hypothetical protein ACGFIW_02055 [Micromonospora sp. NPDC048935]|uniref:hypothetical protein n=1 Tax=Micromonospora sp. NPDC048935 TaxID=3364262 RepID=UPI003720D3B7
MSGVLVLMPSDGRTPRVVPFGPADLPAAQRLRDRYAAEESVRDGRRTVEVVLADGDAA